MSFSDYPREILKIAIAQICKKLGFEATEQSACETLVDITQQYIEEIGYQSRSNAEIAGRTECNFNDISLSLKEMKSPMRDLMLFQSQMEDVPFPHALPRFPLGPKLKKRKLDHTESTRPRYIYSHFPSFPEAYSYKSTPIYSEKIDDRATQVLRKNTEREKVESNLIRLHEQFATTNSTHYDHTEDIIETTWPEVEKEEKQNETDTFAEPTPVDQNSVYLLSLYEPVTTEHPENEKPEDKQKISEQVDAILNLLHQDDFLESLPSGSTSTQHQTPAQSPSTTRMTDTTQYLKPPGMPSYPTYPTAPGHPDYPSPARPSYPQIPPMNPNYPGMRSPYPQAPRGNYPTVPYLSNPYFRPPNFLTPPASRGLPTLPTPSLQRPEQVNKT